MPPTRFILKRERFKFGWVASAGAMSMLLLLGQTAPLLGNPTGGAVVAGSATIGAAGPTLTINQSTSNAIINWQQFSIANGEMTKFIVPNSGATLNRVTGGNPSAIYGSLQSNGTLYLVNPSGIVVGPSGRIDTAGFLASTLDVSNQQFLAGDDLTFSGSSSAAVSNAGVIRASSGDVYLIGSQVNNTGSLSALQGTVGMAAGDDVLFQQAGSEHLFVQATPSGTTRATGVTNAGTIRAAAVELKAAGGNAYSLAINNTGVIAATGYKKINGQVYLTSDGGSISNSGRISAEQANGNGGAIAITGTSSTSTTSLNTVTNSGTLDASARVAGGTGGSVGVKNMTGATVHGGSILAQGGQGGAGGTAEVSGQTVAFTGTVDLTAPGGKTGNLLLDPVTLQVVSGTGGNIISGENDPTMSTIGNANVDDALATANLTLNADTNITVNAAILWQNNTTLTLSTNTAGSTIDINAAIGGTGSAGLIINTKAATDVISCPGYVELSNFTLENGAWTQNQSVAQNGILPIFSVSHDFQIQGGTFLRSPSGDGSAATPYLITDVYGLQGMGSPSESLLTDNFQLANNIDATGTAAWNSGAGFAPIGFYDFSNSGDANTYSGTFNGAGFIINGLTVHTPSSDAGSGLFGDTSGASLIENLSLTNVNINGGLYTGGLVGVANSTINDVYVSGSVTGTDYVGGLAGINSNPISNCYSIASVTGSSAVGGLLGEEQFGSINDCYSSGLVSGSGGGLVGTGNNVVTNSFWDTTTSGQSTSAGGTGDPTATLLMASTYTGANWNIGSDPAYNVWIIFDGRTRPMLAMEYSTTVTNAHQLQLIGTDTSTLETSYTQANDIDASGTTNPSDIWGTSTTNGGLGFVPIGNASSSFDETYDGRGHAITGLYINTPSASMTGLFGETGSFAAIENVNLTAIQMNGSDYTGGLVAYNNGAITSDSTAGTITVGTTTSSQPGLGGLVGYNNGGAISLSYSTAHVSGVAAVGGLVGNMASGTVDRSFSSGSVAAGAGANSVGGFVGTYQGGTISNSYSVSSVTAGNNSVFVGGFAGALLGTVTNSYSSGAVAAGSGSSSVGGFAGTDSASLSGGNGMVVNGTVTNSFWDTDTAGPGVGIANDSGNTGLTGAPTAELMSQAFILAHAPVTPTWDFTNVWTTNGDTTLPQLNGLPSTAPTGGMTDSLSGTAFTDSGTTPDDMGLTIDLIFDGGVLGFTTTNGLGDFTFNVSASDLTAGVLLTDISTNGGNTYYQANAPASTITGVDIYGSTLRVIANTASNTALGTAAGSLAGAGINYTVSAAALNTNGGVNMQIFAPYTLDGNITAGGSLTTAAGSSLTSSAANITLSANSMNLAGSLSSTGEVAINAAGPVVVSGAASTNGFILENGTWTQIVGQNGLDALPTFTDTGDFELQNNSQFERFSGGAGTMTSPYVITDVFGLQGLDSPSGNLLGVDASLAGDVDATSTINWNTGAGFVPITNYAATFNGQGHAINGLYINVNSYQDVGLFGLTETESVIENLAVTNAQVTGTNFDTGAVVGLNEGTLENVSATATVAGQAATGGIVGFSATNTTLLDCSFSGTVAGTSSVGGVVGRIDINSTINGCSSSGTVGGSDSSGDQQIGGLVGQIDSGGIIQNSHSSAVVLEAGGGSQIGGLVGSSAGCQLSDCYATGQVSATASGGNQMGGLIGLSAGNTLVQNCYATGAIHVADGNSSAAGLVGENQSSTITNCYATGNVTGGSAEIGGLVGNNDSNSMVQRSYATGAVTSAGLNIGGLAGENQAGSTITTSFALGAVSGGSDVGGLVGLNSGAVQTTYSTGAVAGSNNLGGLIGQEPGGGSLASSYWAIDGGGQNATLPTIGPSDGTGTIDRYSSGKTLALLRQQSTFDSSWDFTNVWTTYNGTATPQLIGLPNAGGTVTVPVSMSPPSTTTGGADMGGSNIVPPALTPQTLQVTQPDNPAVTTTSGSAAANGTPPFSFTGTGLSQMQGQEQGGLANSSGNSGQVTSGDIAQINDGQLNNVASPQTADALNEALGPIVYQNLADALKAVGDWAGVPPEGDANPASGEDEMILNGGDVAEMTSSKVTSIPLSQAPQQLRDALKVQVLPGGGH